MVTSPTAILFDLDGTLVDSLPGIEFAVDEALAAAGLKARTESLRSKIGPPIRSILAQLAANATAEQLDGLERTFRRAYDGGGWKRTVAQPNAASTVESLRAAGMPLFVVTNKPALPSRQILEHLRMEQGFIAIVSRNSKNPPYATKSEMLRDVCRSYALNPGACLYVGDTLEDYNAATEAGMPVTLVPFGYGSLDWQNLPGSCRALNDLADLLETVESLETL